MPLPQYDIHKSVNVCFGCFESETKRREKEAARLQRKEEYNTAQSRINDLFEKLRIAYEADDEVQQLNIKEEIDKLKIILLKKEKKEKMKLEKKARKKKDIIEPDSDEKIQHMLEEVCSRPLEKLLGSPEDGKCCLVLDIDYTLFDHRWHQQVREDLKKEKSLVIPEFKRPYLHQFLSTCYQKYDIIIWSATGMVAIDSKCNNLGIYSNPDYKVTLVLSKESMLFVNKKGKKSIISESIKPLEVIWKNLPKYTPKNTIHIDDLSSNFQLNPKNGLKIQPFKEASKNNDDTELFYLTKYLLLIASTENDFTTLNHNKWKEYTIAKLWEKQSEYSIPTFSDVPSRMKDLLKSEAFNSDLDILDKSLDPIQAKEEPSSEEL